ncbi:MAG: hypothetical protein LBL47_02005 [Lactobacillus sp.]|jgi:chromosomal replication initiation ATPase DnaA|nr:hypothetical protein [Lactobacillus sp.]
MKKEQQLAINFSHIPCLGREDFMVAKCNIEAVSILDNWPNWPFFAICIYGNAGCGKTHLANVFSNHISTITNYPYRIPVIQAKDITLETPHKLFQEHNCLIVENLDDNIDQEAMFHLYNLYRNEGGFVLFTSHQAPARLNITLPDLRSRLNAVPAIEIKEPDDELLSALVVKLFTDRQIMISPEVMGYIVKNMQRSFSYALKLVVEIDNISLSLKRAISIPIVKEAFDSLDNSYQGELF